MTISGILCFSTSNYEAMIKFLTDFGFKVTEDPHDQLVPLFNEGRGAHIERGDIFFNLEESTSGQQKASFNLMLTDYSEEELTRIKSLGYECDQQFSICGEANFFRTPDGGTFVL